MVGFGARRADACHDGGAAPFAIDGDHARELCESAADAGEEMADDGRSVRPRSPTPNFLPLDDVADAHPVAGALPMARRGRAP